MTASGDKEAIRADWIPADLYRDPRRDMLEAELLWPRVWQMACREADLPSVGSFVRYDIVDDSILVVRTGEGADDIVAYYNVCQHRGRELRQEARGQLGATLACRFHGWQWKIDGSLHSVYWEEDWKDCPAFDNGNLALPRIRVGRWGGWVWINQDPDCEPLMDYLGVVPEMLDPFEPENMRPLFWKTIIAPVNWKLVAEAFNEGYHSWATHNSGINLKNNNQGTTAYGRHAMFYGLPSQPGEYRDDDGKWKMPATVQESLWANYRHLYRTLFALTLDPGMAVAERLRELPDDFPPEQVVPTMFAYYREEFARRGIAYPEGLTIEAWARAGMDWHIFPHSIVLPSIDGALWYRLRPNGRVPDSCIFDIWSFGRWAPGEEPKVENEIYHGFEEFRGANPFLEEDFANLEAVQRGVRNRGFRAARTNPRQEATVNNFQRQLVEYCGR